MRRNPIQNENYLIKQTLENFDFQKCHNVMQKIKWAWYSGIPTIELLMTEAEARIRNAMEIAKEDKCDKSTYFSSSGGLKASAWVNRYGHITGVRLEFVLTDWDSDGDY